MWTKRRIGRLAEMHPTNLPARLLHRQLPAINLRPMCNVQRAMIGAGEDAGRERLACIDFRQHSARTSRGVEDLDAKGAGDVVAADLVNCHAVAERRGDVRRGFVEFEFAIGINRKTHGHRRHFGVEDSLGVDSEGPRMSPAVVRDGQSSAVVRQCDPVGFRDAGIDRFYLARFRINRGHLGTCISDQNETVVSHGKVVGFDSFSHSLHFAAGDVDGDHAAL